jgi:hypothetical protein
MDSAMTVGPVSAQNNPAAGVFFILVGMACILVNDMLIKQLSGDCPKQWQPTSGAPDERANNA